MKNCDQKLAGLCIATALLLFGCKPPAETPSASQPAATNAPSPAPSSAALSPGAAITAVATLNPTQGSEVKGVITFTKTATGVHVTGEITGLKPGEHGFHVHEKGDCSSPDGSSAGGHFNPTGATHGGPDAEKHHAGDMGNITADASGKATLDKTFSFLELSGPHTIVGRGLIVHEKPDDLTSQPAGNAGARLACGVIEAK